MGGVAQPGTTPEWWSMADTAGEPSAGELGTGRGSSAQPAPEGLSQGAATQSLPASPPGVSGPLAAAQPTAATQEPPAPAEGGSVAAQESPAPAADVNLPTQESPAPATVVEISSSQEPPAPVASGSAQLGSAAAAAAALRARPPRAPQDPEESSGNESNPWANLG